MRQFAIIITLVLCVIGNIQSQSKLNFEFQAYPTGLIPGLRYEYAINEESKALFRVAYNWIRHRDLGVHDDERGDGFGFTVGYTKRVSKFDISLKNDFWWNTIDWEDNIQDPHGAAGQTKITVVQPTLEAAYVVSEKFRPSIAFGYEWNAKTDGEETGQGAILLIGFLINIF